jgi:YfiH family protein
VSAVFTAFQFDFLRGLPLRHGLSGRVPQAPEEGNAGHIRDASERDVTANRRAFMAELDLPPANLTLARQTHSARVAIASVADRGRGHPPSFDGFPETDAIVTNVADVAVGITVADCVPLLFYDPVHHALGIAHAGWRGTVSSIALRTVEQMATAFGSRPSDLLAGIGPSIGPCCYEVGDEVISAWLASGTAVPECAVRPGTGARRHFDLWTANAMLLESAGLETGNIELAGRCVKCEAERFFSYRAAQAGAARRGLMLMVAQLQPLSAEGGHR